MAWSWHSSRWPAPAPAAIAYAFLFNSMANEKNVGKRLETVKRADTDRSVVKASRDRVAEAAKRRKSVQDSLKDLEEKKQGQERQPQEAAAEGADPCRPACRSTSAGSTSTPPFAARS